MIEGETMSITQIVTDIQHIGLPTPDLYATIAFYTKLGFQMIPDAVDPERRHRVAFLKKGNLIIETFQRAETAMHAGAWDHIALDVASIEDAYTWAVQQGLEILEDGVQMLPFFSHGVRYFTVVGPAGEKVEFNMRLSGNGFS